MRTGSIKYSGLFVAGVVFIALAGIAPVAQSGTMGNGADQRNGIAAGPQTQATKDNAIAKRCQGQPQLMNSQMCKDAMARSSELFTGGGAKPNSATPH
jgi:hypothetical protein